MHANQAIPDCSFYLCRTSNIALTIRYCYRAARRYNSFLSSIHFFHLANSGERRQASRLETRLNDRGATRTITPETNGRMTNGVRRCGFILRPPRRNLRYFSAGREKISAVLFLLLLLILHLPTFRRHDGNDGQGRGRGRGGGRRREAPRLRSRCTPSHIVGLLLSTRAGARDARMNLRSTMCNYCRQITGAALHDY